MKEVSCKHYNGEGYTYTVLGQHFNLCCKCEMELLAEMKWQEVIENKSRSIVNDNLYKEIETIWKNLRW